MVDLAVLPLHRSTYELDLYHVGMTYNLRRIAVFAASGKFHGPVRYLSTYMPLR